MLAFFAYFHDFLTYFGVDCRIVNMSQEQYEDFIRDREIDLENLTEVEREALEKIREN